MFSLCLVACLTSAPPQSRHLDVHQFMALMKQLHADFKDVVFIYEGGWEFVGAGSRDAGASEEEGADYQGTYAYRTDGAMFLDTYKRWPQRDRPLLRTTAAVLHGRTEETDRVADTKEEAIRTHDTASLGEFDRPDSAQRIFLLWWFQHLTDVDMMNFKYHGEETIDGHRCLRVELDLFPGVTDPQRTRQTFWVDVNRGGHPIQVEERRGGDLLARTRILLKEVPRADGGMMWFPINGTAEFFLSGDKVSGSVQVRETYGVVVSSLRINSGLPDSAFSIDWNGGYPDTAALAEFKRQFASYKRPPPERTDYAGVQERLDESLKTADAQSKALEASAPSREPWSLTTTLQLVFGIGGFILLLAAIFHARRMH